MMLRRDTNGQMIPPPVSCSDNCTTVVLKYGFLRS
jgi:hypothetical protein